MRNRAVRGLPTEPLRTTLILLAATPRRIIDWPSASLTTITRSPSPTAYVCAAQRMLVGVAWDGYACPV